MLTISAVHSSSASGGDVGDPDAALLQHGDRLGDVLRAFDRQVGVVDGDHRLESRRGHEEQVREAAGHEAVQRDRPVGELLGDVIPPRPTMGCVARRGKGVSSASKPVAR